CLSNSALQRQLGSRRDGVQRPTAAVILALLQSVGKSRYLCCATVQGRWDTEGAAIDWAFTSLLPIANLRC
ncbi:MAG: hypothetical protein MUQ10_03540, partial [Anaerolineae bacterium]|nr:hypothetical protein [Anaerolineae bacterium]